jgi:hypothetical protein
MKFKFNSIEKKWIQIGAKDIEYLFMFMALGKKKKKKKTLKRNILKKTPLHSSLLVNQLYKFQLERVQRITYEI